MSMQPIFLLPLSTTVWGEIDEQIRSWAALKKETFTRIFIRLIPPSFPTKCFLYCSKVLLIADAQPVAEHAGDGGVTFGLLWLEEDKVEVLLRSTKDDRVVPHLGHHILGRHLPLCHAVLLHVKL